MAVEGILQEIEDLLSRSGVKPSPIRVMVVRELANAGRPLSSLDIETRLDTVDHSSVSRTISLLMSKHLLHQIPDGSGSMKYELCREHSSGSHTDQHVHFHCRKCGITKCIEQVPIQAVDLPDNYQIESCSYIINGLCPDCNR